MGRVKPPGRLGDLAKIRAENRREVFQVLPAIKEVALRESGPDPDRDPFVIHPSEMAKADWCVRATFYRMSGKPEPARKFNYVLENIFAEGNSIHAKFQHWLRGTGKLFGLWVCVKCDAQWTGISGELPAFSCPPFAEEQTDHVWEYREVRLRVPGCSIVGRADGALEDALVECKSVGIGTLRAEAPTLMKKYYLSDVGLYNLDKLWKELRRPFPSHVKQANIYLWLAKELGLPYTRMIFIYEFKPNQQVKEFAITLSDDIIRPLLAKADKVVDGLKYNRPPKCSNDAENGCDQCKAYEEPDDTGSKAADQEPKRPSRRVVTRSTEGAGEAGSGGTTRAPSRKTTRPARGADGPSRPRADRAHGGPEQVDRVPRLPGERGPSGRAVRTQARREADRNGASPQQRRVRQRDESGGPG